MNSVKLSDQYPLGMVLFGEKFLYASAGDTVFRLVNSTTGALEIDEKITVPIECNNHQPSPTIDTRLAKYRIEHLIRFKEKLFVCTVGQCSQCFYISKNFQKYLPYPHLPVNSIGGQRSSLAFTGHFHGTETLYVAHEFDGQQEPEQSPPYISARSITKEGLLLKKN